MKKIHRVSYRITDAVKNIRDYVHTEVRNGIKCEISDSELSNCFWLAIAKNSKKLKSYIKCVANFINEVYCPKI